MKIREAIVTVVKGYKLMEGASDDLKEFIDMEACDKSLLDQLFAIREDGCRLGVIREKGELPEPILDIHYCRDYSNDMAAYKKSQQDMLKAHYVQEATDEQRTTGS